ncbi:glycosyl transferase [Aureimonas endophytica]|uniref:Glycosyl transferase n=1 Tax=Aureimonas endophytica TaxID=2027858 RepID=A0A917E2F2_9HYPH|nr:glycosyltransferase family 39 protein [Aureimonas endophytica]GGD96426.1 glycosyl transferase [Aureimonas endophytica]
MTTMRAPARRLPPAARAPEEAGEGWHAALWILVAIALLRVLALVLSPSELGFDEAQYWAWSRHLQFGYATKPPLIAWLIAGEAAVCGPAAPCVRLAAPLLHLGTAIVLSLVARRLYGGRTAFWTGLAYLLMPGVALSSMLMTTDALLLFFWSLALLVLVRHLDRPALGTALAFGLVTGIGLYAKYAMIFLPVMIGVAAIALPELRRALRPRDILVALLAIALLMAPNVWWNIGHGFATFTHTGEENIGWSWSRLNARKGFEFFVTQFGVAGPIVFGAMLNALLFRARTDRPDSDRLLLWLSWPIVLAITVQGFLAQANANWGATAYPAGVVLATALMVRHRRRLFLVANFVICGLLAAAMLWTTGFADPASATGPFRQFRQLGGWSATAGEIAALAKSRGAERLAVESRALTAGLVWALRDEPLDIRGFLKPGEAPADQFEIDSPWRPGDRTEGTLILGITAKEAGAIGAVPLGTVPAPLYLRDPSPLTVYGFPAPGEAAPAAPASAG